MKLIVAILSLCYAVCVIAADDDGEAFGGQSKGPYGEHGDQIILNVDVRMRARSCYAALLSTNQPTNQSFPSVLALWLTGSFPISLPHIKFLSALACLGARSHVVRLTRM
ncbi:hypothetical protein BKA80DRAFT_303129 [Phyllosticta citrichinensis]